MPSNNLVKNLKIVGGSICAPLGFRAGAVFADIKRLGTGAGSEKGRKDDLAIILSDVSATVAGMFTSNQVSAPPVKLCAKRVPRGTARAIVVNSGNANACTGREGMRDAEAMARKTAAALSSASVAAVYDRRTQAKPAVIDRRYSKISAQEVLVCSTGRIGVPMPMENVARGIEQCAISLGRSDVHARAAAEAIMTSDTRRKEIAVEVKLAGKTVRIGGICKGAGMIQPLMRAPKGLHATMLGFVTTDAAISARGLRECLSSAVSQSFNRITVDGDMSTNDSVIALANGLAENGRLDRASPSRRIFQEALDYVCLELAKMIVRDGEGISRVVRLLISGARNNGEAESAARSIANSALVKTSWCGGDPNWGRILCAVGYSAARIDEAKVDIAYAASGSKRRLLFACRNGQPTKMSIQELARITSAKEFDIHVKLRRGNGEFVLYAADLTEDYVSFNKGNINDPSSLGG